MAVVEMIGLQFIAETFHMEYKSIAEQIGVSKQTFQDWLKERRKIPQQRLEQLSAMFGIMDKELFQKELSDSERLEIQMLYFQKTDKHYEVEMPVIDHYGNEYTNTHSHSQNKDIIEFLQEKSEEARLVESVERIISTDGEEKDVTKEMIKNLVFLIEHGSESDKDFIDLVLYYLADYKNNEFGGVRPQFIKYAEQGFLDMLENFQNRL
jgi:transcriptional regulator with XRE-family HTH domain